MTLIRRTNPFGEMLSLRQALYRLTLPSVVDADAAKPRQIEVKATGSGEQAKTTVIDQPATSEPSMNEQQGH